MIQRIPSVLRRSARGSAVNLASSGITRVTTQSSGAQRAVGSNCLGATMTQDGQRPQSGVIAPAGQCFSDQREKVGTAAGAQR